MYKNLWTTDNNNYYTYVYTVTFVGASLSTKLMCVNFRGADVFDFISQQCDVSVGSRCAVSIINTIILRT